jgi:hypothetical protein
MNKRFSHILIFICFILFSNFIGNAEEVFSPEAPIELYLVVKTGDGNNANYVSSTKIKNLFLKRFRVAGFHVLDDQDPPFVSKTMEHYGAVHGGRTQSSGIGYVHLLLMDANSVNYFSDLGQEVVLKSDPKSITWLFEQKKALEMADKAGAKYAFVVNVTTQLIYQNDSPKPVYNITLEINLYQADNGNLVFHQEESMVKLASSAEDATWGACQFLSRKIVEEMQDSKT